MTHRCWLWPLAIFSTAIAASSAFASGPISTKALQFEISRPVRDLPPPSGSRNVKVPLRVNPLASELGHGQRGTWTRGRPPADPLLQQASNGAKPTPPLDLRFKGIGNPFACGGCSPPDTNGDVGLNEYVQIVNASPIGVFNKADGKQLKIFDLGSLWTTGPCAQDVGDPVAVFDAMAQRWLFTQLASPHHVCIAVSQTSDPLGAYYLYLFDVGDFPDYFKLGVWSDAYLGAANQTTYTAMAFDRAKMLVGDPNAGLIKFDGETNLLMPASVTGPLQPAPGGYFFTFKDDAFHGGKDRIELFRLTPNFRHTNKSKFELVKAFKTAPFTYTVCGFFNFDCIPQKGTSVLVDAVSEWPMQHLAYRLIGSREELVGNFTVGGGSADPGAAVRWFELRNTGNKWKLIQEGTQDLADGLNRFMGSISIDQAGDIALGYSASSANDYPSIRYATRTPTDPPGTLGAENVLKKGKGSQIESDRWGDYSGMVVDPVGGCQFWYTNEFYPEDSGSDWQTEIGAFTVPECSQ
ncbi:MAG: hypothetical protein JO056_02595 [Alphaproteobacteria bacterium]|nr:hypothetical protein [Alphaproteobacteria bacterium]